jgi:hypothetical protein
MNKGPRLGGRKWGQWTLLLPFLSYWTFAFIYYHVGLQMTAPMPFGFYAYLATAFAAIVVGFRLAKGSSRRRELNRALAVRPVGSIWLKIAVGCAAIGNGLLLIDKMRAGVSASVVIKSTEFLREAYQTSLLTTLAVPFCAATYPAIVLYVAALRRGARIDRFSHLAFGGMILSILLTAVSWGNRAAFLQLIFWTFFAIYYVFKGPLRSPSVDRLSRRIKLLLIPFTALTISYFVFISSFRISSDFLSSSASHLVLRYDTLNNVGSERVRGGILMLSSYVTGQFEFSEAIYRSAPVFTGDFTPFYLWYLRQLSRFGGKGFDQAMESSSGRLNQLGLSEYGWPSLFGHSILSFGTVGALQFLFILGASLGYACRKYERTLSTSALLFAFTLYCFLNYSYMAIPNDHNFAIAPIVALFMWIYEIRVVTRESS